MVKSLRATSITLKINRMKRISIMTCLFLVALGLRAQTVPDSLKYRVQQLFYKQRLKVDAQTARRVAVIQGEYDEKVRLVYVNSGFDVEGRIRALGSYDSLRLVQLGSFLGAKELALMKGRK